MLTKWTKIGSSLIRIDTVASMKKSSLKCSWMDAADVKPYTYRWFLWNMPYLLFFEKKKKNSKIWNCCLLHIVDGALWVNMFFFRNTFSNSLDPDCDCQPWSGPKLISKVISSQTDLDLNCLKVISMPLDGKRNKLAFTVCILLSFP